MLQLFLKLPHLDWHSPASGQITSALSNSLKSIGHTNVLFLFSRA